MSTVKIFGASDDLIELEGDIDEEFSALGHSDSDGDDGGLIAFSDGTVVDIRFTENGTWRITPVCNGSSLFELEQCTKDDEDNYSDHLTLTGDIKWAVFGSEIVVNSRKQAIA